jgi:hypothetical protein
MKVDRQIVAVSPKPHAECDIAEDAPEAAGSRGHDHVVEMWIVEDDRRRRRFDEIRDVRVGKPPPQRMDRRRGEHDITNLTLTDQQDPRELVTG